MTLVVKFCLALFSAFNSCLLLRSYQTLDRLNDQLKCMLRASSSWGRFAAYLASFVVCLQFPGLYTPESLDVTGVGIFTQMHN